MTALWIGVIVVSALVEVCTAALVSVWFVAGALLALIANQLGASNMLQYVIFIFVSLITAVLCRPIFMKNKETVGETDGTVDNIARYIGKTALVTEEINNITGTGRIIADGISWAAKNINDDVIKGGNVQIVSVQGSKMVVKPIIKIEVQVIE